MALKLDFKLVPLVFAISLSSTVNAVEYQFTRLASTVDSTVDRLGIPTISQNGEIVFTRYYTDGRSALVYADGTVQEEIIRSTDPYNGLPIGGIVSTVDIDSTAGIAFTTVPSSGSQQPSFVFRYDQTGLTRIAEHSSTRAIAPAINSSGSIAYVHEGSVYVGSGSAVTPVFQSNGVLEAFWPDMNDDNQITFDVTDFDFDDNAEILLWENGVTTPVDTGLSVVTAASIDSSGNVYYHRLFSDLIKFSPSGSASLLSTSGTEFSWFNAIPSVNNLGDVIFYGGTVSSTGHFLLKNGEVFPVLLEGDLLDGLTIDNVSMVRSLNDSGDIALLVEFLDGSSAVYAGHVVPEPRSLGLLLLAGITIGAVGRNSPGNFDASV